LELCSNVNGPALGGAVVPHGGVAEWSIAAVLKTVERADPRSVGSNPTPAAHFGKDGRTHRAILAHTGQRANRPIGAQNMVDAGYEAQVRRELEGAGEDAIREGMKPHGPLATGGEPRLRIIRAWLREQEQKRDRKAQTADWYMRATFWVAVGALAAGIIGIIATILHK
jgi:hypothetical protein